MRIISGSYRGKIINPPKNFTARPTTDMAKEGLFNILANNFDFEEVAALDLFSGSGSISFEFASRGCPDIDLVEINPVHYAFIAKTAKELGFSQIHPVKHNAFQFLKFCNKQYNLIFADPPYDIAGVDLIPQLVFENNLLAGDGWLIIEHSEKYSFNLQQNFLETRKYGKVNFSIFAVKAH